MACGSCTASCSLALHQLTACQSVCSRPTAVNLSDAAQKLSSLAGKAAAQGADGQQVAQTIIRACEVMLHDDVAANQVGAELRNRSAGCTRTSPSTMTQPLNFEAATSTHQLVMFCPGLQGTQGQMA